MIPRACLGLWIGLAMAGCNESRPPSAPTDLAVVDEAVRPIDFAPFEWDLPRGDFAMTDDGGPALNCFPAYQSTIPAVWINWTGNRCRFTLAEARAGIGIPWEVRIGSQVPGIVPRSALSACDRPGPSGLIVSERLTGNGQGYCLCDVGLCPAPPETPVTLQPGKYPGVFEWDGRNWQGPSDTNQPKGAPFPAGTYTLEVSAIGFDTSGGGKAPFSVQMKLPITLVP